METFVDIVPSETCSEEGPLYTITTTSNLVMHETIFDDGRVHATFTQTGTFSAVPLEDPSLPSFTGKFTQWGGFNQNGTTVNGTFTFNLRGTGSDGSTIQYPPNRSLQRPPRRHGERVLPLPLARGIRLRHYAPGLAEPRAKYLQRLSARAPRTACAGGGREPGTARTREFLAVPTHGDDGEPKILRSGPVRASARAAEQRRRGGASLGKRSEMRFAGSN